MEGKTHETSKNESSLAADGVLDGLEKRDGSPMFLLGPDDVRKLLLDLRRIRSRLE